MWTYRTNTSLATGLALDGHVTLTMTAHGATEVEGRTYDAYVMSVSGSGSATGTFATQVRSEEHTSELQSQSNLVCRLLLENKNTLHTPVEASSHSQITPFAQAS